MSESPAASRTPRWLRPSIGVALGAWLTYTLAVNAVQLSSGVPYAEWFTTASHAWRVGVLSLVVGSALLLGVAVLVSIQRHDRGRIAVPG